MAQLVTRIPDELAARIDRLIDEGTFGSRSDAVRRGLELIIDTHRRRSVADAIVAGYRDRPQDDIEMGWADAEAIRMIGDEPW